MCDLSQNAVCPCLGWVLSRLLLTALSGPVLLAACEGVAVAGGDSSEATPGQQVSPGTASGGPAVVFPPQVPAREQIPAM